MMFLGQMGGWEEPWVSPWLGGGGGWQLPAVSDGVRCHSPVAAGVPEVAAACVGEEDPGEECHGLLLLLLW